MIWLKEYINGGLYSHHICLLLRSNKDFVIGKRMICNTADDKKVLVLYLGDKQKVTLHQKYNHKIMICTKESIKKSIKILQPS